MVNPKSLIIFLCLDDPSEQGENNPDMSYFVSSTSAAIATASSSSSSSVGSSMS